MSARSAHHAITGVAIANGLGTQSESVFARAFAGEDGFSPAEAYLRYPFDTQLGVTPLDESEVPGCAPTRLARIAFASARALAPAVRVAVERWGARRVAYVFASSTGGLEQTERAFSPLAALPAGMPYRYADHSVDATSAAFARFLGVEGPRSAVATACSSSLKALATAGRFIDHGLADAAVVGSADALCRTTIFGFAGLGLLDPGKTRPFATGRGGLTLGEGSAYVLLEKQSDQPLGWLDGVGESSDAYHQTSPHPEGLGAELAMRQALRRAGLSPSDIDLVSAHATGTRLNDAVEGAAIARILGRQVAVTATKSLTGHTLGTSGLTALVLAIESLRRQEIPATLRSDPVDPALGLRVVQALTPARLQHILINAFGFGGSNASAVVSGGERKA